MARVQLGYSGNKREETIVPSLGLSSCAGFYLSLAGIGSGNPLPYSILA